jgi:hypothetical protein
MDAAALTLNAPRMPASKWPGTKQAISNSMTSSKRMTHSRVSPAGTLKALAAV